MNHTHLEACPSTQIFLKENLSDLRRKNTDDRLIVSCEQQTAGQGRSDHQWTHFPNALAFSCTFKISEFIIAPSLFLAVGLVRYFEKNFNTNIYLKWPNDLYTAEQKKCGGILCHAQNGILIAGIGINWGKIPNNSLNASAIFPNAMLHTEDKKKFAYQVYQNLIQELPFQEGLIEKWQKSCIHLHQKVYLKNGAEIFEGIFNGVNKEGAALIDQKTFYSGSLSLS